MHRSRGGRGFAPEPYRLLGGTHPHDQRPSTFHLTKRHPLPGVVQDKHIPGRRDGVILSRKPSKRDAHGSRCRRFIAGGVGGGRRNLTSPLRMTPLLFSGSSNSIVCTTSRQIMHSHEPKGQNKGETTHDGMFQGTMAAAPQDARGAHMAERPARASRQIGTPARRNSLPGSAP